MSDRPSATESSANGRTQGVSRHAVVDESDLLSRVRAFELDAACSLTATAGYLQSECNVIELGGGNGYQASLIADRGCKVRSYDLSGRPSVDRRFHAVIDYDGVHLPEATASTDVVFSSNVLEHVKCLPELLAETRRVLRPGGLAVHIVPTPSWRLWTSLAHYPFLVCAALGVRTGFVDWSDRTARRERARERGVGHFIRRMLWAGPHGEFPSALAELRGFQSRTWTQALVAAGFEIVEVAPSGIYYSGYGLIPKLSTRLRHLLARWLGSSTQIIVARRPARADGDPAAASASACEPVKPQTT